MEDLSFLIETFGSRHDGIAFFSRRKLEEASKVLRLQGLGVEKPLSWAAIEKGCLRGLPTWPHPDRMNRTILWDLRAIIALLKFCEADAAEELDVMGYDEIAECLGEELCADQPRQPKDEADTTEPEVDWDVLMYRECDDRRTEIDQLQLALEESLSRSPGPARSVDAR